MRFWQPAKSQRSPSVSSRRPTPRRQRRQRKLLLEFLEDRCLLACTAVPEVTLTGLPTSAFIGDTVDFTASFQNGSLTTTGYGPYVSLVFPATGVDGVGTPPVTTPPLDPFDGLDYVSATFLGVPLTTTILTFPGPGPTGTVNDPYGVDSTGTPLPITGKTGDKLVVFQLPFGSFTPGQPAAAIVVTAHLSNGANVPVPLTVNGRAAFQYGCTPLNDPATDPTVLSVGGTSPSSSTWSPNGAVTPTLITLNKTYLGPEDETATGPNFPRQYEISASVATGQTLTTVAITDVLPTNIVVTGVTIVNPLTGTVNPSLVFPLGPLASPANNVTLATFPSVTGTGGADAVVRVSFYVPRLDAIPDAVIPPLTGAAGTSLNQTNATAAWQPLDPRDDLAAVTAGPAEHNLLHDRSLAIQKSVARVTDVFPTGYSPDDTVEYTLNFQVSDFFAFQNVVLDDVLSDGQRFDTTFTPTLTVTEHGLTTPASSVQLANYTVNTPSGSPTTQALQFRVSNELTARQISPASPLFDTNLTGGCVPSAGTGGLAPDCTVYNAGQTTGQVKFRAVIQRNYGPDTPPTGIAVVQADHLNNGVTASGGVLNDATLLPTGSTVTDTSAASFDIVTGTITKKIYAINGNLTVPNPPVISPGDQVTYEITVTAPITRFDDAYVFDFLPLPVFYATEVLGPFIPTVSSAVPAAGTAKFGPNDTFYAFSVASLFPVVPTISSDATANSVQFAYGSFAASPPVTKVADILFTVTASSQPFADGLFITNQARVSTKNTPGEAATEDEIIQIKLATPAVSIYKGVVGYNSTGLTLGGIAFNSPAVTTPNFSGGPLNSQTQAIAIGNSNATGLDAADPVRFAIVAQNTGGSDAYNVGLGETIPAGYVAPVDAATFASTTHLTVYLGSGGAALTGQLVNATVRAASAGVLATGTFNGTDTFINAPTMLDSVPLVMGDRVLVKDQAAGAQNGIYVVADAVHGTWVRAADFAVGASITTPYAITILGGNTNKNSFYTLASSIVVNTGSSTWNLGTPAKDYFYSYDPTAKTFSVVLADNKLAESDGRTGSLNQGYDALGHPFTDGSNAAVVLYDLLLDKPPSVDAVQPLQIVTNTASLTNYAGSDNGPNFLTSPLTDPATVTVAPPQVAKTLVSTSIVSTVNRITEAVIGEKATYSVVITVPEGVTKLAQFVDTLDTGLAFVSLDSISASSALTTTVGTFAQVLANAQTALAPPGLVATFNFGTLTNSDTVNTNAETITITYTAVVLDVVGNQSGTLLNDTAAFNWTNPVGAQQVHAHAADNVTVIEPKLATTKTAEVALIPGNKIGQQSDTVKYTITIAQDPTSQTDAFDASFSDPLPKDGLNGTLILTPSFTVSDTAIVNPVTVANFQLTGANATGWTLSTTSSGTFDMLKSTPRTITITVTGTLPTYVTPGQQFTNTDTVQWTSLPGVPDPSPISQYNTASTERTGAGGVDDYRTTANDTVTVAYPSVAKTLIDTSIDNGLGSSNDRTHAVIGETAVYQVVVTVPQGTTPAANLIDTLPAGLAIVSLDSITNSDSGHLWTSISGSGDFSPVLVNARAALASPGSVVNFNLGTITNTDTNNAIPETLTFRYQVVVLNVTGNLNGVTLRNSAQAWWNNMANFSPIGQAEAITVIEPQLQTTKAVTIGGGVGNPGDPVTYTLTIQQAPGNPTDAFDVTISDHLPTASGQSLILSPIFNVTTSGSAPSVTNSNFQLTGGVTGWTLSSIGSFNFFKIETGSITITITGTLADVAPVGTLVPGQTVVNTDNLQWTSLSGSPGQISTYNTNSYERTGNPSSLPAAENNFYFSNGTASFVAKASDLRITKTDSPDPVLASGTLTYTLTVTNDGPAAAPNTVVTDTLPTNVTFVSAPGCTHSAGVVTSLPTTLNPGASVDYTITVTVNPGTPVGTVLSNVASVTSTNLDPILSNNTATANTTVTELADLQIAKTNGVTTAVPGGPLSYTIVVTNGGPSPVTGAHIADLFPSLSSVTWTAVASLGATGFTASGTGTINDTVTMPNSSTITYTVTGTVLSSATGNLINTGTVTPPPAVTDPNLTNNTATHTDTLTPQADLAVTKTDAPDPVLAGAQITYTVTVTNLGLSDAATVVLTDSVPVNTTFVSATVPSGWTRSGGVISGGIGTLTFSKDTLAALDSASFTIVVKVNPDVLAPTTVTNLATATTTTTDPVLTNNTATATTTVNAQADVAITKSGPGTIIPGQNMTYTLTATNNGPSTALTVLLTDLLPLDTTFFTVTVPGGWGSSTPAVGVTGTVTFSKVSMAAAETASFTIVVNVPAATLNGTSLINSATVTAATPDPTPTNNAATTTTTTTTQADLAVTKSGPATVLPNGDLSYTIIVTNNGPNAAQGAVVTDPVPTNTTFRSVGALPSGWAQSIPSVGGTGTVQFTNASLAAAETASFTIVVRATAIAEDGSKLTNMATVVSSTTDPVPNNNTATATTTVVHQADLAVTKTNAGTVVAGTDLTYTVTVTNNGPNHAINVAVSDPLPLNTTLVSVTLPSPLNGWSYTGTSTLLFSKSTFMDYPETASFTIVVHTNEELPIGSVLKNTATVTTTTLDPTPANNSATATTTVSTLADLAVTKTGVGTVLAGNNLTYTVTVTNNGPSHAINVAVSDSLPLNTTFVSLGALPPNWSASTPAPGGTGTITFSKSVLMDYPETATFTIVVHVNADTANATTLNNTATVTSTTADPGPGPNSATATTTVNTQVDLVITKTGPVPATVIPGNNLTYTLVVTNNGPSDAQTVTVADPIPANTTFFSVTPPSGWTRTESPLLVLGDTGTLTFAKSTAMAAGTTATFTIEVKVGGVTPDGTALENVATVDTVTTEPVKSNNTATATTTVTTQANLAVTKTGPPTIIPGDIISYTIVVTNGGPNAARNATLTDPMPAGTTLVSVTPPDISTGWSQTDLVPINGNGTLQFSKSSPMTDGETETFTIVVRADIGLANGVQLRNGATVSSSTTDPILSNNTASVTTTTTTRADLEVTKSDLPDPVIAGTDLTYTLNFVNHGPNAAQTVLVRDATPTNTTFVSATSGAGWTITAPSLGGTGNVDFTKTPVAIGETAVFTIVVRVAANTPLSPPLSNTAIASSATVDPTPGNNASTATTTVNTRADVSVTKTGSPTALAGGNFSYTVLVTNVGPSDAQNVVWSDTLPADTSFVSQSQSPATPTFALTNTVNTINDTIDTLPLGASVSFTVTVHVASNVANGTVLSNTATVSSSTSDTNLANNTSSATTTVSANADLAIQKTGPATVSPGGLMTYTLTVTNNGYSDAAGVSISDPLPTGTTFVSAPDCTLVGSTVTCAPGLLAKDASITYTVTVTVDVGVPAGTSLVNTATVTATTPDRDPSNNTSTKTTTVTLPVDLVVVKSAPGTVLAGDHLIYTLTVRNDGPFDAMNVTVSDLLPIGTQYVGQSQVPATAGFALGHSGRQISNTIALFPAGSVVVFLVDARVNAGVANATVLNNTATITSSSPESNPANNTSSATTTVDTSADLTITKTDGVATVVAGDGVTYTYTIVVSNTGPSDAQGVQVTDTWPTQFTRDVTTPTQGSITPSGSNFTWNVGSVSASGSATLTVKYTVPVGASPGAALNTVSVTSSTFDPNAADNTATDTTTVTTSADLVITKSDSMTSVVAGNGVTYSYLITVSNTGFSNAQDVVVTDTWPTVFTQDTRRRRGDLQLSDHRQQHGVLERPGCGGYRHLADGVHPGHADAYARDGHGRRQLHVERGHPAGPCQRHPDRVLHGPGGSHARRGDQYCQRDVQHVRSDCGRQYGHGYHHGHHFR
ncbi:MAG: hypothetical protein NTY19_18375 [Planctomycetota bacterium]|nr:hypothetical protein [Planctomycetota bacterium]